MAEKDDAPTLEQIESGSIADDIRAAMGSAEAAEPAGEPAPETPAAEPEAAEPEQEGRARDEKGRARDEKGRFLPKEGAAPETPEGERPEAAPEGAAPAAEPAPEEDPLDPPVDWTLERQEAFRKLPVDHQKFLLEQVTGVSEKLTEAEKTSTRFKAMDDLLAPRREQWAREGFDEVSVIRQILALSDQARDNPAKFIVDFAAFKGIDLARLLPAPAAQPDPNDPYADDPVVQRVNQQFTASQQRIAQLEQQLQQVTGTIQTQQQREEQARQQRVDGEIASFSTQVDEKGKPKHPYFQIVRPLMATLVEKGQAPDLQTAYDMACYANPEVRAKIAAAAKAADERDRARKAQDKAQAAKKAGSSVSGAPGARTEPQPTGDLRDELRAAMAQHSGTPVIQ